MHAGDQTKGNHNCDGVGINGRVWDPVNKWEALNQPGHQRLANPAQGEADNGDT